MTNRAWLFWLLLALAFGWFLSAVQPILLPFIVGMGVAYLLDPAADWLETKKCSRTLATLIICSVFFVGLGLALLWFIPALAGQLMGLVQDLPRVIAALRDWLMPYVESIRSQIGAITGVDGGLGADAFDTNSAKEGAQGLFKVAGNIARTLLQSTTAALNLLSLLFITPIVSFYLLRDWDRITAKLDELLPRNHADTIRAQCKAIDTVLAGFLRGTLNVSLILATFYMITLSMASLNYSLLIGLIGGLAIIIPYLGTVISGTLAVGMALMQFTGWEPVAVIAAIFVVGQIVEGNFLTPKLVGDKVGLHPVWMIFGMLAGATLLGFVGVLLAVPIAATLGVLVRFGLQRYRESSYYTGKNPS